MIKRTQFWENVELSSLKCIHRGRSNKIVEQRWREPQSDPLFTSRSRLFHGCHDLESLSFPRDHMTSWLRLLRRLERSRRSMRNSRVSIKEQLTKLDKESLTEPFSFPLSFGQLLPSLPLFVCCLWALDKSFCWFLCWIDWSNPKQRQTSNCCFLPSICITRLSVTGK